MPIVNFNISDFERRVADSADLILKNRYYEENPSLTDSGVSLLARPGLKRLTSVGNGPIRGLKSEPGSFGGDLFIASGDTLFRMDNALVKTSLYTGLYNPEKGFVKMAITAEIGTTPAFCFIADGRNLFYYNANSYAFNSLTGTPANTDQVRIDNTYYQFTNGSVNAGSPAGTAANPWLVALGASSLIAFTNLANAINNDGVPGTDYSTALTEHPTVRATGFTSTLMPVEYKTAGAIGNGTVTTETGAALSWTGGGTMTGGGTGTVRQVYMPEDIGVIDVAVFNSFVLVIPVQEDGYQGRFYWIEPGEVVVNSLNFATAERSPDGVYGVEVFGDQFWLPGENTTEVWYATGDQTNPMRRLQGIVLDRGSWQNTAKAVHEQMIVVDADGGVFLVRGGQPQPISSPSIAEQIRKAIAIQQTYLF